MSEIVLAERARTAATMKYGGTEVSCPAGRSLKIETSPAGEDLLDAECPAGKVWTVRIDVQITETDA